MLRKRVVIACSIMMLGSGCATVDPKPDYNRAAQRIAASTGQERIYQPGEEELGRQRVEELLLSGLTTDEAVEIALLNNRTLQAAFMDLGMARADVVQAGILSNPSLGITAGFPAGGGLAGLDFGITQNIAELWQIPPRKRAAEQALEREILELARYATDLAADVKTAYYRAIGAERLYALSREDITIAQKVLDLADARLGAGAASELDVNLARGVVLDSELAEEATRLAAAEARRKLARLLALTLNADSLVLIDGYPEIPAGLPDNDILIELACAACLDIQAARLDVARAKEALNTERRRVLQSISLGLAVEREKRQAEGGRNLLADTARASLANGRLTAPEIEPRSAGRKHTDITIGPTLEIELPIFDQNQAQIAKAEFAFEQAVKKAEALELAAVQEVRSGVDRALSSWRLAGTYRERAVPIAQRNLELSQTAYRAGQTSFLAVLEAQRQFLDSRSHQAVAAREAAEAVAELDRITCQPLDDLIRRAAAIQNERETNPSGVEP